MTKLTESAIYSPTIFRLETTTPVAGGEVILDGNDDPVQGYANAQAQLLANRTKYLKGVTDTLGTAAVANLTTSSTDTTAGRVLKVADFGIGARTPFSSYNLDLLVFTGFYSVHGSTSTNLPIPSAFGYLTVHGIDTNNTFQAFTQAAQGLVTTLTRVQISGAWQPWVESWNGSRPNSVTVDTGSFGYGAGSGGTVTQVTSKGTGVTVHKPSGRIITAADSLAAGATAGFALTNNKIAATDCLVVNCLSNNNYRVECAYVAAGSAGIRITNLTAGALAEIIYLNFSIIKGASA